MTQIQPSLGTFPPAPIPSCTYRHALFPCTPPLPRCLATDLFTTSTAFISKRYVSASLRGLACPLGAALQWSCEVAACIGDLSPARLTQSSCASARARLCGRRADAWSAPAGGAVVASFVVCEAAARAPQRLHHPRSPGAAWMTPSPQPLQHGDSEPVPTDRGLLACRTFVSGQGSFTRPKLFSLTYYHSNMNVQSC